MDTIDKVFNWLETKKNFTNGDNLVIWILIISQLFRY